MHVLTGSTLPPRVVGREMPGANGVVHPFAPGRTLLVTDQSSSRIESGWMSIRAPVSLAARRAFWPSFPIASESW